jgi:hypothetical protein
VRRPSGVLADWRPRRSAASVPTLLLCDFMRFSLCRDKAPQPCHACHAWPAMSPGKSCRTFKAQHVKPRSSRDIHKGTWSSHVSHVSLVKVASTRFQFLTVDHVWIRVRSSCASCEPARRDNVMCVSVLVNNTILSSQHLPLATSTATFISIRLGPDGCH